MEKIEKRWKVVLVDDHRFFRVSLANYLKEEPRVIVVGEAESGAEALEMTRSLNPDVVVMDVNMPDMNGIEATRILKHERPQVKVIGLSMHSDADVEWAMKKAGATSYLTKDSPATDLVGAILACDAPPGPRE